MRMLVVAATAMEVAPFVAQLGSATLREPQGCPEPGRGAKAPGRIESYSTPAHQVDVLVTGVGMVATAAWCSRALAKTRYDVALNLGVCGTFDRELPLGEAVHVVSDRISELGAEAGESFLTIHELGLLGADEFPFTRGELLNPSPPRNPALERLRQVRGITVNTVHGRADSIAGVAAMFAPQVESMEGAAFMYACLTHGIAFAQVRAISNVVEIRTRAAWKLEEAVASLGRAAAAIVEQS